MTKKIIKQLESEGLECWPVRYRFKNVYKKGFDIVTPLGYILYSFEPIWRNNGARWLIKGDGEPIRYWNNLHNVLNHLDLTHRITSTMRKEFLKS